ncbi:MAG: serine/threonine protein kinase [Thermoguttaceae bacterium]|nr:serine/threonine protein kinase [Thermoguttaceae bacterium]MDW8036955.1 serine/threonine-protein kinase [Thermoguttaceae bacterium]
MDPIVQQVLESQHGLRIVRRIARGGFAEVFEAQAIPSGIPCAIKVSLDPLDDDNPAIAKELENLQYLKLLSGHPRIVVLMDVWVVGGYLVTRWELAPDEKIRSLEDLLKHYQSEGQKGIPPERLLRYISEAAEGIDFLNGQGIYHRDIKPANLLLFWDHVKIGDLGLAKFVGASVGSHSGAGTMGYLPPEAYQGELSSTVDLYSLAATYLKLRTGQEPFGRNPEEILQRQKNADPILNGLSKTEAAVVRQALAPEPEDRPQEDARAWCRQLADALGMVPNQSPVFQQAQQSASSAIGVSAGVGAVQYQAGLDNLARAEEGVRTGRPAMPSSPPPVPMDQAVTFGISGAIAGSILGAITGAIAGAIVWTLAGVNLNQISLGALGGGIIGTLGGGFLAKLGGFGKSMLRALVTVVFGLVLGTILGIALAGALGMEESLLSAVLLTAAVGAMVWGLIWAILGALLGASDQTAALKNPPPSLK